MVGSQISPGQMCRLCVCNQWCVRATEKLPSIAAITLEYLPTGYFASMFYAWTLFFFYYVFLNVNSLLKINLIIVLKVLILSNVSAVLTAPIKIPLNKE